MRPIKLTLDTHVDNGWMYRLYRNQAAASYLSLITFSQELWGQKCLNSVHLSTMGGCIVYTRFGLLPLICPIISSFFFLSNYQTLTIFVTFFSGTVSSRKLKLGTHMDKGCMYRAYRNMAAAAYLFHLWVHFLSLQFSVTNLSFSYDSTITGL